MLIGFPKTISVVKKRTYWW